MEVAYSSLQNPNKQRNGDFCKSDFLEKENILLAVLCDGVGSNACDWKAAQVGCELFIEQFKKEVKLEIKKRITASIQKVNQELLLEVGTCQGMKSTFSLVVWELEKNQFHYVSIGDSRIYEYAGTEVIPISKDESKSVILRKKDGKPMIISGIAVVAEGVTNVIGSSELKFDVFSKTDKKTKGVLLASDGFYNASMQFQKHAKEVFNSLNFQKALDQLQATYKGVQKDDMTILMVRKVERTFDNNIITKSILSGDSLNSWTDLELSKAAISGIEKGIKNKNASEVEALVLFVVKKEFDFGRKAIGDLIALMAKEEFQERDIYQLFLQLLRKSKFD